MAFSITDIKSHLRLGGARPTLFNVRLTFPNVVSGGQAAGTESRFMIQATALPSSTIRPIEVPYFGRKIKVAGDRTFGAWTVSIINDEDFVVRQALEQWHNNINSLEQNLNRTGSSSPETYKVDAEVIQYNKIGDFIRTYKMHGVFPTEISPIDLAWDKTDEIETFNVTFAYDWYETIGHGKTGDVK